MRGKRVPSDTDKHKSLSSVTLLRERQGVDENNLRKIESHMKTVGE